MKKTPYKYYALFTGVLLWASFLVPSAEAQTTHFVIFQQSQVSQINFYNASQTWTVEIGNGNSGTTTGAFITTSFVSPGSSPGQDFRVLLQGYSDSGYVTNVTNCAFTAEDLPANYVAVGSSTNPFTQLTHIQSGLTACTLNPSLYYKILINAQLVGPVGQAYFFGNPSWTPPSGWIADPSNPNYPFFPQFAIVGDNFQITPTASSSGLFLSGANTFCASAFGSSTAPGIVTDIGIGFCDAIGYLFVPTPASVQQFQDFSSVLQLHIPFSYVYEGANLFENLQASSTENFPVFSFGLAQIDFASSTAMGPIFPTSLEFLSSTTINKYMPVGMHDLLYNIMIFVIWVDVLFVLYHKVVPAKAKI